MLILLNLEGSRVQFNKRWIGQGCRGLEGKDGAGQDKAAQNGTGFGLEQTNSSCMETGHNRIKDALSWL